MEELRNSHHEQMLESSAYQEALEARVHETN